MITADFHTHTDFSSDSDQPMEGALEALIAKGISTVCFTEHMDMDYPGGEFDLDTAAYRARLMELREWFRGRIEVLFGVELGLMDYLAPRLEEYVSGWDFDFVIGSSHLVDGVDPYYPEYFAEHGDHNGILRYFESILANITAFRDFDVYGHLDYVVRYSGAKSYSPADYAELLDEILKRLIATGKGIELNTAGLKYGLGWAHPGPAAALPRAWRRDHHGRLRRAPRGALRLGFRPGRGNPPGGRVRILHGVPGQKAGDGKDIK